MTRGRSPVAPGQADAAACTISVVVPTYQRRASVIRLCASLARQTVPAGEFELVVSIDGSDDGTGEALARTAAPYLLRTLWQPNRGRAAALNAGVLAATGELIVLLDDDMEPVPRFLTAHRRAHADGARRGVMGAAPMNFDGLARPATRYVSAKFNGHLDNLRRPGYTRRLTDFYSGNFSIRREVLLAVGGFDEDFRIYGNEDLELSLRLTKAGVDIVYDPEALANQYTDKDFAALARDSTAEGRTAVLFARKHPDAFADLKLGSFNEGPGSLRLLRNRLLGLSQRRGRLPEGIIRFEKLLARLDPPGMPAFYRLALGYFYWLGARAALADVGRQASVDERLARLATELES
jgi:GT2 family glycosyltransferase